MSNTLGRECNGSTPNMRWIILPDGRRAIWKPWDAAQFNAEQDYEKISKFFGMQVSPCVERDGGFASVVSYNQRMVQVHAYDVDSRYSLIDYQDILFPEILEDLRLLMFVDAVCNNTDRHNGNLAFLKSNDLLIGVCPAYDNCATFEISSGAQALFGPSATRQWHHTEVFKWLSMHWYKFADLLSKYASPDFDRLAQNLYYGDWVIAQKERLLRVL